MKNEKQRAVDDILGEKDITPELLNSLDKNDLKIVAKDLFGLSKKQIEENSKHNGQLASHLILLLEEELNDMVSDMSDEEIAHEKNKDVVRRFVSNQDNQSKAVALAMQIREGFERNWFTVRELQQAIIKTRRRKVAKLKGAGKFKEINELPEIETIDELRNRLGVLQLFGLVKVKSDPKGKRPSKYKVVLTVVQRTLKRQKRAQEEASKMDNQGDGGILKEVDEATK